MNKSKLPEEETAISELTIGPDGRIFVFGASRGLAELLHELAPGDEKMRAIVAALRSEKATTAES